MGAASAKSAASWCEGGNEGPKGGIAVVGGRGIMTGAEPNAGNASPPAVWWRGLCGGGGPELGSVGSVATGCTAADMDRSTPPNSTGRHPPEPGPLLTAGRIPPPPGSGAYGKYSSSINRRGVSRGNEARSCFSCGRTTSPRRMPPSQHRSAIVFPRYSLSTFHQRVVDLALPSPIPDVARLRPSTRSASPPLSLSPDRPKFLRNLVTVVADWRSIVESLSLPSPSPVCLAKGTRERSARFRFVPPSVATLYRGLPMFTSASLVKRPRLSRLLVNNEFPLRERGGGNWRAESRSSLSLHEEEILAPFPKCVSERRWTSSEVVAPTRTVRERNDRLLFFEEKNNCRPKEEEDALEAGNRTGLESSSSSELGPSGLEASSALVASLSRCDGSPRRLSYCPRAPVYLDHNLSYSPCFQWRHFFLA